MDIKPKNIQVCVSPGEDYEASLGFAVAEARRRECGIHLSLVLRPIWVGSSEVTDLKVIDGEWRKYGTDFLMECEHRVQLLTDGAVPVSTEIIHGPVVPSLAGASENASLVVMQHHRMNRRLHVPSLSVTNGVAARAHAPLVAVPDTWRETDDHHAVVAVGVEDPVTSRVAAATAFEEAQRLGAAVHLVRAWFFSAAFDADVFTGEAGRTQTARVKEEVQRGFAPVMARFADVEYRIVVVTVSPQMRWWATPSRPGCLLSGGTTRYCRWARTLGRSRVPSSTTRPGPSWSWTHVGSAHRHVSREHDE